MPVPDNSFFTDGERLAAPHNGLLKYAAKYGWQLEAWAVFPNHYHFVGHSPEGAKDASSLSAFLKHFHSRASAWLNKRDDRPGRKVWHNYWETGLTFEKSYFARLNYVHQNPVRHGVVSVANQYPLCSAAWFERTASPAMVKTIYGFKMDHVTVVDDF
ncbi:MAG TPA: transposase [Kiritimatiellia bacterium]|nr:transposase [Kiritimatiellia bacterium]